MNNAKRLLSLQAIGKSRLLRSVGRFMPLVLTLLIGLTILYIVIQRIGLRDLGSVFLSFISWGALPIVGLTVLSICINILRWKLILKHRGYNVPYRKLISPWLAGNTVSYITPIAYVGGEFISCQMLKDNSAVDWAKGFASIAVDKILDGTLVLIAILAGVFLFLLEIGVPSFSYGLALSVSVIVGFTIMLFIFYSRSFRKKRILRPFITKPLRLDNSRAGIILESVEEEVFQFFRPSNKIMWLGLLLTILKNIIGWLRYLLLIFFLGKGIVVGKALSAVAFSHIIYFVPIPGGLGIHEAMQTFTFSSLGMGADTGVAFTLIVRGVELITVASGIVLLIHWGTRSMVDRFVRPR